MGLAAPLKKLSKAINSVAQGVSNFADQLAVQQTSHNAYPGQTSTSGAAPRPTGYAPSTGNYYGPYYTGMPPTSYPAPQAYAPGLPLAQSSEEEAPPPYPYHEIPYQLNQNTTHLPMPVAQHLERMMGLSSKQVDAIMSLISLPEHGSTKWWEYYNYIELGDDAKLRGYTVTLFGACSGTGDLLMIFDRLAQLNPNHSLLRYHQVLRSKKKGDIRGLEGLGHPPCKANYDRRQPNSRTHLDHIKGDLAELSNTDPFWQQAVWDVFIHLYWNFAMAFCSKNVDRPGPVLQLPISKGFLVDTALNHGTTLTDASWTKIFHAMRHPHETDEIVWLHDFIQARKQVLQSGFEGLDWSKSGSRCDLWLKLMQEGNFHLSTPFIAANSSARPWPVWPDHLRIA